MKGKDASLKPVEGSYQSFLCAAATGLTRDTAEKKKATAALIRVETANARWRDDGTDPAASATGGFLLETGDEFLYTGDLSRIKFIESTGGNNARVHATLYR